MQGPVATNIENAPCFDQAIPDSGSTDYVEDDDNYIEWYPINSFRITPTYERNQVALHCCRETVNLKTLKWIMADEKWIEILPEMMSRSESLTLVIHVNAVNYLTGVIGATSTPSQVSEYYICALRSLQKDLYDPIRQASDETLFAVVLLGVFDVPFIFYLANVLASY